MRNELWEAIGVLEFVYQGRAVTIDPQVMLVIDEAALTEAMTNQGADFASLGFIVARLEAQAKESKRRVVEAEAKAHKEARQRLTGQKPTVATLEAEVALDPKVQAAHREHITAEETHASIKQMMAAMRMRAEMLTMLGAWHRSEMGMQGRQTPTYEFEPGEMERLLQAAKEYTGERPYHPQTADEN